MSSSLRRMLAILDGFSAAHPIRTAEEIADDCQYTRASAYRYIKELTDTGLLQRVASSKYALGTRIITFDYLIRQADPLLQAGLPLMREIATQTGCDCIMSALYGDQIFDTHREVSGRDTLELSYGRGRSRPLFRGAAPKVILANLPRPKLHVLYDQNRESAVEGGYNTWEELKAAMNEVRRNGFYASFGELEPSLCSLAAPVFGTDDLVVGAIQVTSSRERFSMLDQRVLTERVTQAGKYLSLLLSRLAEN
jgi:DNA-binding IclR family transcriptional regulator